MRLLCVLAPVDVSTIVVWYVVCARTWKFTPAAGLAPGDGYMGTQTASLRNLTLTTPTLKTLSEDHACVRKCHLDWNLSGIFEHTHDLQTS